MFQSVIQQSGVSTDRFGVGVWVSLLVHAGVLGVALLVSGITRQAPPPEEVPITFIPPRPSAPSGVKPSTARLEQKSPPPKPTPARRPVRRPEPRQLIPPPQELRPEEPTPPDANTDNGETAVPTPPGGDTSESIGAPLCPDCPVGPTLSAQGTGEEVVPFGEGMTPPQLLSVGVPLRYTSDAIQAGVRGLLVARCTITREGKVDACRVIKGLPFMDQAVLESLASRHYRPVSFQGRPVNALYTFNVNLRMP